ncbi:MAG: hypothetical protein C0616_15360 [Desulfuromonas sp.]|nr:MAG: hypothetical protein C0616_15360 [Desulfuromonas sp.]
MSLYHCHDVETLALKLDLWGLIQQGIRRRVAPDLADGFILTIASVSVKPSRATRRLGSYSSCAGRPVSVRIQFSQEMDQLRETFLHEVAHACDHLHRLPGEHYRQAHGEGWRTWMESFGLPGRVRGESPALCQLYQKRLKVVATCLRCGEEIRRTRRLNRGRRYRHVCGGRIAPV